MSQFVLITGSGRDRVGRVLAVALAKRGFDIGVHYHRSADEAEQTVAAVEAEGVQCAAYQANMADEQEVEQMFQAARKQFRSIAGLVTTASIWRPIPFLEVSAKDLRQNFDVNTVGTFLCAKYAGQWMSTQADGGCIVTFGDWAIQRPYPNHLAYFASKGAIPTLTRALAIELAVLNPKVRVNCIHPGPVMFPPDADDEERAAMIDSTLVKTANCPESVATAVISLLDNPFMTGTCVTVDGGRSIYAGEQRKRPI